MTTEVYDCELEREYIVVEYKLCEIEYSPPGYDALSTFHQRCSQTERSVRLVAELR